MKKKTKRKVAPEAAKSVPIKTSRISPERITNHAPRIRQKKARNIANTTRLESFIGFSSRGMRFFFLLRFRRAGTCQQQHTSRGLLCQEKSLCAFLAPVGRKINSMLHTPVILSDPEGAKRPRRSRRTPRTPIAAIPLQGVLFKTLAFLPLGEKVNFMLHSPFILSDSEGPRGCLLPRLLIQGVLLKALAF